jgi:hypothetical protein
LFRIFIFGTFVLPFAVPLLLGPLANRVAIEVRAHLNLICYYCALLYSLQRSHQLSLQKAVCVIMLYILTEEVLVKFSNHLAFLVCTLHALNSR